MNRIARQPQVFTPTVLAGNPILWYNQNTKRYLQIRTREMKKQPKGFPRLLAHFFQLAVRYTLERSQSQAISTRGSVRTG